MKTIAKTLLFAIPVVLSGARLAAEETAPPEVPISVVRVVSGGEWQSKEQRGSFRIVLEERGFEHISSVVWVEWLSEPERDKTQQVVKRVCIAELSTIQWSVSLVDADRGLVSKRLEFLAEDIHEGVTSKFIVILGAPGKYRIEKHAV